MKQITLNTKPRTEMGRTASKHLRQQGIVPAIIYGESGVRHLTLDAHEFGMAYRKFSGTAALIELKEEGGDSHYAIIQELQRNPRTDAFVHIDFKEIVRGKEMETDIPVTTRGTADGVKNYGGVLEISTQLLRVRCRPRDLPEAIVVDVTELEIGKSIHLSEVEAPEGVTFLGDPELVLIACVGASAGASGAEEEEAEGEEVAAEGEAAAVDSEEPKAEEAATAES
ncbi:MAG: 50S ribosomal protein L25 [Puniceicoccaceae bacterium]